MKIFRRPFYQNENILLINPLNLQFKLKVAALLSPQRHGGHGEKISFP